MYKCLIQINEYHRNKCCYSGNIIQINVVVVRMLKNIALPFHYNVSKDGFALPAAAPTLHESLNWCPFADIFCIVFSLFIRRSNFLTVFFSNNFNLFSMLLSSSPLKNEVCRNWWKRERAFNIHWKLVLLWNEPGTYHTSFGNLRLIFM